MARSATPLRSWTCGGEVSAVDAAGLVACRWDIRRVGACRERAGNAEHNGPGIEASALAEGEG
eukprot:3796412-Prymnesium_polylepis.1